MKLALGLFTGAVFATISPTTWAGPTGACCFADADGTCIEEQSTEDCGNAGGVFQGFGSRCTGQCPRYDPDNGGWQQEAPFRWGDTQGRNDTCSPPFRGGVCNNAYPGPDAQHRVTIPWPSNWTVSTAFSAIPNTELEIGDTGGCSTTLVNMSGCVGSGCTGAQNANGTWAVFKLELDEGDVINVNVENFDGDCGKYDLSVTGPCADITLPAGDPEGETCGVRENDGCNMDPGEEAFTPIELGQTYLGKSFMREGGTDRDTDWYQLVLGEETQVTMDMYGEFGGTGVGGIIQYEEGREGSGDCDDMTGFINPFGTFNRCTNYPNESRLRIVSTLTAGTWWFFAGPAFGGVDFDCDENPGADYWIHVYVDCVPPAQDGDVDGSGCVDFDDLLLVLSNFGSNGPDGDNDCNGSVDFDDLLAVLSGFGDGDC